MPVIRFADYPVDKNILAGIAKTTGAQFFEAKDKASLSRFMMKSTDLKNLK